MKTKFLFFSFFLVTTLFAYSQTTRDSVVTVETKSGGIYTGKIIFEDKDSIRIDTKDWGLVTIFTSEVINHNLESIETLDGNEFLGEVLKEDARSVTINTRKYGEITLSKSEIKSRNKVEVQQIKKGKYWFPNPQSTRYFWSPNGYGLKKGEGYYQNIWVLWNQFSYGITDNISIGGGIIPVFLFGGPTPVFATLKFSIPVVKEKFNVGGGAIAGYVLGEEGAGLGIVYGLATLGSHDANVTFGMGYGFAGGEWAQAPLININGMFRVSSRGYFITENYIVSVDGETIVVLTLGGRSIIKKAALDYGLVIPVSEGIPFAFPWLGFTIPFGNTN
jgi:hypothetical protein